MKAIEILEKKGFILIYTHARLYTNDNINIRPLKLQLPHAHPKLEATEHILLYKSLKDILLGKDIGYFYFPAKSFYVESAKYVFYRAGDLHILI